MGFFSSEKLYEDAESYFDVKRESNKKKSNHTIDHSIHIPSDMFTSTFSNHTKDCSVPLYATSFTFQLDSLQPQKSLSIYDARNVSSSQQSFESSDAQTPSIITLLVDKANEEEFKRNGHPLLENETPVTENNTKLCIKQLKEENEHWKQMSKRMKKQYDFMATEKEKYYRKALKFEILCEQKKAKLNMLKKTHAREIKVLREMNDEDQFEKYIPIVLSRQVSEDESTRKSTSVEEDIYARNDEKGRKKLQLPKNQQFDEFSILSKKCQKLECLLTQEKQKCRMLKLNNKQLKVEKKLRKEFQSIIQSNHTIIKQLFDEKLGQYEKHIHVLSVNEEQLKQQLKKAIVYFQTLSMKIKQNVSESEYRKLSQNEQFFIEQKQETDDDGIFLGNDILPLMKYINEDTEGKMSESGAVNIVISDDDGERPFSTSESMKDGFSVNYGMSSPLKMFHSIKSYSSEVIVSGGGDMNSVVNVQQFGTKLKDGFRAIGNKINRHGNYTSDEDILTGIYDIHVFDENQMMVENIGTNCDSKLL